MVDADSPEMFYVLYESVREDWAKKYPTFVHWFDKTTSTIKQEMLANVRTSAGLGCPPKRFYTHISESNNLVVKHRALQGSFPPKIRGRYETVYIGL